MEVVGSAQLPLTWRTKVDDEGGAVTLELTGELDRLTAPSLSHQLDQLLAAGLNLIVLDVSDVRFMDLGGYRLLVDIGASCAASEVAGSSCAAPGWPSAGSST